MWSHLWDGLYIGTSYWILEFNMHWNLECWGEGGQYFITEQDCGSGEGEYTIEGSWTTEGKCHWVKMIEGISL